VRGTSLSTLFCIVYFYLIDEDWARESFISLVVTMIRLMSNCSHASWGSNSHSLKRV
jgi:hypothetical protein